MVDERREIEVDDAEATFARWLSVTEERLLRSSLETFLRGARPRPLRGTSTTGMRKRLELGFFWQECRKIGFYLGNGVNTVSETKLLLVILAKEAMP